MTTKQVSKLIRLAIEKHGEISLCSENFAENFQEIGNKLYFWFNSGSMFLLSNGECKQSTHAVHISSIKETDHGSDN